MKNTPLKVAELATIIYAILVFMSLLVDSAYYRQFNINIVSYMSVSEILLSCIEPLPKYLKPFMTFTFWFVVGYVFTTFFLAARDRNSKEKSFIERLVFVASPYQDVFGKLSKLTLYIAIALYLPFMCFFMDDYSIWSVPINPKKLLTVLFIPILIEVVLLIAFCIISHFFRHPHPLSFPTRQLVNAAYSSRITGIVIIAFIGIFSAQLIRETQRATIVKETGSSTGVLLEGDGIHIDTRTDGITYIGESAGFIFLYNKTNQSTAVYDRSRISNYRIFRKNVTPAEKVSGTPIITSPSVTTPTDL